MDSKPVLTLVPTTGQALERVVIDSTEPVYVGRSSRCHVRLPAESRLASRLHATIAYRNGAWYITDESRRGTFVRGEKLRPKEPSAILDGDAIRFGDCEFAAQTSGPEEDSLGPEGSYTLSSQAVDLGAIDATRVLASVLTLPARLSLASEESGIYSAACEYLVSALSPVIATAYACVFSPEGDVQVLGRANRADVSSLRGEILKPIMSRRIARRLLEAPESVLFIQRNYGDATFSATVDGAPHALGASLLESDAAGNHTMLYAVGDMALVRGGELVAQYLRLVSTLVRQHLLTLRRSHLSRCFSPQILELLGQRDGAAALSGEPTVTQATSLFFDVRGSSLRLDATPQDLAQVYQDLRRVLSIATESVFAAGGTIIDYAGDAVFAVWGVPFARADQADCAVGCAMEITRRVNAVRFRGLGRGGALCGIGIASGEVLAGAVGSSIVFKYGVFGPSVSVAARLASLTKPGLLGRPVLMTAAVRAQLDLYARHAHHVGEVDLPGIGNGVEVHEARIATDEAR
jgi:class 3 adenylate cyclase